MHSRIIVLDNIRSLLNVGAIFRSADGAGYTKVILTGLTPTPPRPEISKTALWAENFVVWEYYERTEEALRVLQEEGYSIAAIELTKKSLPIAAFQAPEKLALVVGHETEGVSREVLSVCNVHIALPMRWKKTSLNVSVAASVAMYLLPPIEN